MNLRALLETQLFQIGKYQLTVGMLVSVAFVWLFAWVVLRVGRRVIFRERKTGLLAVHDKGRRVSLYLIAQYLVWTLAAIAMLRVLSIDVSVVLAGSAALLVGISLGIQQIARDFMSGIFLLFEGTIEVGDVLQVDGVVGKVREISLRTSEIQTRDGQVLIVPNSRFITERVTNWSFYDDQPTAFPILIKVPAAADEDLVRDLLLVCAEEHADVLQGDEQRPALVRLTDLDEEKMTFELVFWTLKPFDVENIRSDLRFAIRRKLRQHETLVSAGEAADKASSDLPAPPPPQNDNLFAAPDDPQR